MPNRRIEMYEYRAIIYRLRQGMTARQIAKSGLAGRHKINAIRQLANQHGWLNLQTPLPDELAVAQIFDNNPQRKPQSTVDIYQEFIVSAINDGANATVIHEQLIERFNFKGAYNCVQRFVKKIKDSNNLKLTVPLDFNIGEAAQVDFGKGPKLFDQRLSKVVDTWFFVMTLWTVVCAGDYYQIFEPLPAHRVKVFASLASHVDWPIDESR